MTNRLILNERIQNFLDDENRQIWDLILQDDIDTLLTSLQTEDDILNDIIKEILSDKQNEALDSLDFSVIREGNGGIAMNLVKLIFALNINGKYDAASKVIEDKLFEEFPYFIEKIQNQAVGYPMRRMHESVLSEAATIRMSLTQLIYLFHETGNMESLHSAIMMRTKITLAIMGNHKHILGHDMIETARIKELIGDSDAALNFYNATRDNLKGELHWFMESPDMGPNEDDVIMLQALKESYLSIDRLKKVSESDKVCELIDEILSREYIDVFEGFDDEDEDD